MRSPAASRAIVAAPSIPASWPKRAGTISTTSRAGHSARCATTARAGSSSMSPAAMTPPPTTTTDGLKMFTSDVMPMPR